MPEGKWQLMKCKNCADELAPELAGGGPVHAHGWYACDVPSNKKLSAVETLYAELPDDAVILGSLIEELDAAILRLREITK
jgi:hypothetical protein